VNSSLIVTGCSSRKFLGIRLTGQE